MKRIRPAKRKKKKYTKPTRKFSLGNKKIKKKEILAKESRKTEVKRRKNFIASLLLIVLLWMSTATFIYLVDPETTGALQILILLVFASFTITLSFLFTNTRRGLIASSCIAIFLIMRYLGVGNIINLVLMLGIALSIEYYFYQKD